MTELFSRWSVPNVKEIERHPGKGGKLAIPGQTGDYELKKAWPASGPVHANSAPEAANSIIPGPQLYRSLRRRRSPDGTAVLSSIRDSGVLQGAFPSQPAPPPPRSRENRRRICLYGRQWPECLSVQTDSRASSKAAGPGSPQQAQCPAGIDRQGTIPPPTDPTPRCSRQMLPVQQATHGRP